MFRPCQAPSGKIPLRALPVALLAALGVAGCTGVPSAPDGTTPDSPEQSQASQAPEGSAAIPDIVDAVQPSVVTIFTDGGLGSGVIYSEDGLILTNEHVVRGNDEVEIAFADGQRVNGAVTATDQVSDLALVQADREGLPAADFAAGLPQIGELAVVIGSPLGFENTATAGIISGLHRSIPGSAASSQSLVDLIQTDAPISPGNSGGAVVNSRGQVIGISEAYIPPQAGAVALGFAIPAATAMEIAEELQEDGTAEHAFMGLVPGPISERTAEQLGLPDARGVAVMSVVADGPADAAGLQPGDVLTTFEGEELEAPEDLLAALRNMDPGDEISVDYRRDGQTQDTEVVLAGRPAG
jgi:serine protease DegQ